mmetsp:Transcript_54397/g.100496  ORF Transcript_54397/g.100496 Transcript_54397/m.100496 type:complete len:411 (-) Transcript_54397:62-1294(-)
MMHGGHRNQSPAEIIQGCEECCVFRRMPPRRRRCMVVGVIILMQTPILFFPWPFIRRDPATCMRFSEVLKQGQAEVQTLSCDADTGTADGDLVLLSCPVDKKGLQPLKGWNAFQGHEHVGVGLRVRSEMLQCVWNSTLAAFSTAWLDHTEVLEAVPPHSGESKQRELVCGTLSNPAWPADVPKSQEEYIDVMHVGGFSWREVGAIRLDTPVPDWEPPQGWSADGTAFYSSQWEIGQNGIGRVRVSFYSNDWSRRIVTVLGENNGGIIDDWVADDSREMCNDEPDALYGIWEGALQKEEAFTELRREMPPARPAPQPDPKGIRSMTPTLVDITRVSFFVIAVCVFCHQAYRLPDHIPAEEDELRQQFRAEPDPREAVVFGEVLSVGPPEGSGSQNAAFSCYERPVVMAQPV